MELQEKRKKFQGLIIPNIKLTEVIWNEIEKEIFSVKSGWYTLFAYRNTWSVWRCNRLLTEGEANGSDEAKLFAESYLPHPYYKRYTNAKKNKYGRREIR